MKDTSNPAQTSQMRSNHREFRWLAAVLLLFSAFIVWFEWQGYQGFVRYQQDMAAHATRISAAEVTAYLQDLQRANRLLLADKHEMFVQLRREPDNDELYHQLSALMLEHVPEFYAFTLADNSGRVIYDDLGERIGPLCRQDIESFARHGHNHYLQIHPGPGEYHFDIMQQWRHEGLREGMFFASFRADGIAAILRRGQAHGHQLMLVREDRPTLIEVTAAGARNVLERQIQLTEQEQRLIDLAGASQPVEDANWLLLDVPPADLFSQRATTAWQRGLAVILLATLLGLVATFFGRRANRRGQAGEGALPTAHRELRGKLDAGDVELQRTREKLAEIEHRRNLIEQRLTNLAGAVEHTASTIIICELDGRIDFVNPAVVALTGRAAADLVGTNLAELQNRLATDAFNKELLQKLDGGEAYQDVFTGRRPDGETYHWEQSISPLADPDGRVTGLVATGKDITGRLDSERKLNHLAHHDALTGLPNRMLLADRLDHAMARADRKGSLVALLFMDLDRFKTINDSLGHEAGDSLLVTVAERIQKAVRRSDTIARLGGDEFVAVLEDINTADEPAHVASAILAAVAEPMTIAGHEVTVRASIGITLYPTDQGDARSMFKYADAAMYKAKAQGGNTYHFYTEDMTAEAHHRLVMESRLRHALEKEQFHLRYQPRQDLASGDITAVEALLRWQPDGEAALTPAAFFPTLEESGLIREVGQWVLGQIRKDFARLHDAGHPLRIACNLSSKQFSDERLVGMIDSALQDQVMSHENLELEITENLLAGDIDHAARVLSQLHDRGVRISVDDFGTGYSSMTYLKRFPIDDLKIDQGFIQHLNDDKDDAVIVTAVISLAHSLGMGAVAEGVETPAQLQTLGLLGCDEAQGMLVSEPLPLDELIDWLEKREDAVA